ncbi:DNA-binding transcriptional regulator, LysR family [Enhydrobacter aerosaccus]|uniref:DNA-binding transcriptional regulator, LysR family n=1 Tax=Enhydrobacter aerosaccus TaxID=225324 RepID=A0A1T4P508_9HYPH|nr:LysR family transcriptional regulator [Enhydrobacter aerosaccus]SJZ86529.1 DNA-binding transcriptional regulator, LysR family [Enhydrobacter aerosaccus]
MRAPLPDLSARQLEAVLALAEYGSFIAAAARLRVSQPALTRLLQKLESELGVRLFDRSTRRVQITEAGREFAAVAERMLNDLGITVQSVREVAQERRGLVVVSCVMSVAGGVLPRMIAAYRSGRPGVEIHIREGVYASILDDVRSGVADFGISYVDELPDFAVGMPLGREVFHAVVPARHKLAKRRSISLAELAAHPIVALPTESRTRRTIDAAAVTAGVQLRQRVVVTQIATLLALVGAGVGVGVVPGGATRGPPVPGVKVVPLAEPRLVRRIGLITLREREATPAAAGLMALLRERWRQQGD